MLKKKSFNHQNEDLRIFKDKYSELKRTFENLSMPEEVYLLLKLERDAKILVKNFKSSSVYIEHLKREASMNMRLEELGHQARDVHVKMKFEESRK